MIRFSNRSFTPQFIFRAWLCALPVAGASAMPSVTQAADVSPERSNQTTGCDLAGATSALSEKPEQREKAWLDEMATGNPDAKQERMWLDEWVPAKPEKRERSWLDEMVVDEPVSKSERMWLDEMVNQDATTKQERMWLDEWTPEPTPKPDMVHPRHDIERHGPEG